MEAAKLTRVEWISYYDYEAEKRFSDWERATECSRCNHRIVHVYTVQKEDGAEEQVGRECAYLALGWRAPNAAKLSRLADEVQAAARRFVQEVKAWGTEAKRAALPTAEAAIEACRTRNHSSFRGPLTGLCVVFHAEPGFYAIPEKCDGQARALAAGGWSRSTAVD